ncbi:hypothetical protein XU18_4230 [Perkinsela sp. CCAP 1560/4]|nr:hypothetical protein XU18_4230 [Perkinsela sp. CCAP 1560/4]|eukprot:KNH04546.1 hypothetical protein XU18_4230 [Perkinsela sp. CCAP 1560/4]
MVHLYFYPLGSLAYHWCPCFVKGQSSFDHLRHHLLCNWIPSTPSMNTQTFIYAAQIQTRRQRMAEQNTQSPHWYGIIEVKLHT